LPLPLLLSAVADAGDELTSTGGPVYGPPTHAVPFQ
jgi:hypothetical protein